MKVILKLLIYTLSVMVTAYLLTGVEVENLITALIVAIVLGLLNTFLKPILIVFTLPINILTLGLFTFVINASLVLIASSVIAGFSVTTFWWALLFSLLVSLVSSFLEALA